MQISNIESKLSQTYPAELSSAILNSYIKAISEFRKHNWKYSINEMGSFIENCFRIIQNITLGNYTAITTQMPSFNQSLLSSFENSSTNHEESCRIIIPRILFSMYCVRNKRGAIHPNGIDPNKMDSQILINSAKWVLAELLRLSVKSDFDEAAQIIDSIMDKDIDIIWDNGKCLRILDVKMSTKNQILCLLYIQSHQNENDLQISTEYKNKSDFKKILKQLHMKRLIEYSNGKCLITPLGEREAEKLFNK